MFRNQSRNDIYHTPARIDTSFTDSPTWIKKMKMCFGLLDVEKNDVVIIHVQT